MCVCVCLQYMCVFVCLLAALSHRVVSSHSDERQLTVSAALTRTAARTGPCTVYCTDTVVPEPSGSDPTVSCGDKWEIFERFSKLTKEI